MGCNRARRGSHRTHAWSSVPCMPTMCLAARSHSHTVTTDKMEFDMLKQHMIAACFVDCFARCLNLNDPVCRSMHIGVLLGLDHQRLYR